MLTSVANGIRIANRNFVLRHPNGFDALVFRRTVTRTYGAAAGSMGGMPTLGGIGVLDADEEPEISYDPLGDARVVFTGVREPSGMSDTRDVSNTPMDMPREVLFEPVVSGAIEPKDGDLLCILPGAGIVFTYEVTDILAQIHIPPYVMRLQVQAQGDQAFSPQIAAMLAARPTAP